MARKKASLGRLYRLPPKEGLWKSDWGNTWMFLRPPVGSGQDENVPLERQRDL
jgi:hypothetical protein